MLAGDQDPLPNVTTGSGVLPTDPFAETSAEAFAANQPPQNRVPGSQVVSAGSRLIFSSVQGNSITVTDPDAANKPITVTLAVDQGTLTIPPSPSRSGLQFAAGDGMAEKAMTITGPIAVINSALQGLSYEPPTQKLFQWTSAVGGNNHWYEYVSSPVTWSSARADAMARGGTLATVTSAGENSFLASLVPSTSSPWLGGSQDTAGLSFSEPGGGWTWVTGEPWDYAAWDAASGEPNDGNGGVHENYLMLRPLQGVGRWFDVQGTSTLPYVVEYVTYPFASATVTAVLTVTTNDLGNVGTGGAKSDADTVAITVSPVSRVVMETDTGKRAINPQSLTGAMQLVKTGAGNLVLDDPASHTGGTAVAAGTVVVRNERGLGAGPLTISSGATAILDMPGGGWGVADLFLDPNGRLELDSATMTIAVGSSSVPGIQSILQTSFSANWSGTNGITSLSAVQVPGGRVGYVENDDGSLTLGFAVAGDINLDGSVDSPDIAGMLASAKFNTAETASWSDGDFNYDGILDVLDISEFLASAQFNAGSYRPQSTDLTPISTADGAFATIAVAGLTAWQNTGSSSYLYCRRPTSFAFTPGQNLYARVTYYDDQGGGTIGLNYDAQDGAYTKPVVHSRTSRVGSGEFADGYFELENVLFGKRENGQTDMRIVGGKPGGVPVSVRRITLSDKPFADPTFQFVVSRPWQTRYTGPAVDYVDATTLDGTVMVGYQGWFRTPNDLDDGGWSHWVKNNTMTAENFAVDMWPDVTAYDPATLARAGSVMTRGGDPAFLFSSTFYSVVQQHFRWMKKHNIDGAFVQRFKPKAGTAPEWVLHNVSRAAAEQGLIWAVEYDVSGMSDATVAPQLQADWQWLTTQFGLLQDPRYAHEGGKPVVAIWGLSVPDRGFTPANANAVVDYFHAQGAYVIGGIPSSWGSLSAEWQAHIARYDGVLVWQSNATAEVATFDRRGQDYYPHVWPGFSWANLKQQPATPPTEYTDRSGGQFYWTKGRSWINAGADRLFIGMFDEFDEGTAIMPMTDDPPDPSANYGRFLDNQGKPADWWMMLTDELKRMMWEQRVNTSTLPTVASLSNRSNIGPEASIDLGATDAAVSLARVSVSDGDTIVETVAGRECRGNLDPATDRYMYFDVSDSFAYRLANGDVTIEVEYFDATAGAVLGLQYDGTGGAFTSLPSHRITTNGSNTWRTVRFEITDASFGGRQSGDADFRLTFGGKKFLVNRVWVRLPESDT